MSKIRVHEMAKAYSMSSKDLREKLQLMNISVKNHMSVLEGDNIELIKSELGEMIHDSNITNKNIDYKKNRNKGINSWVESIQGTLFEIKNEKISNGNKKLEEKSIKINDKKTKAINPYIVSGPVEGKEGFVGRKGILRNIQRFATNINENSMLLYGQRRIGKTSILYEISKKLSKKNNILPIYYDLQGKSTLAFNQFVEHLSILIAEKLNTQMVSDCNINKDLDSSGYNKNLFSHIISQLTDKKSIIFLFDEFDALDRPANEQSVSLFLPFFSELMSLNKTKMKFIFVISKKPEDLSSIYLSLFKDIKTLNISLMPPDETEAIIRLSEKNRSLIWKDEEISNIQFLTGGQPYITQQLCLDIWTAKYENINYSPEVKAIDVEDAILNTIKKLSYFLEWLWDDLGPAERVVASALANCNSKIITQTELENILQDNGVRMLIGELRKAPKTLKELGLISIENEEYQIRFEIFRRWIIEKKPLAIMNKEMDRDLLVAENLFQAAYRLYQGGELQETTQLLKKTLEHNSNHMKANELLAEIFLARGEILDAITLLEKLYNYNPIVAKPRFVEALLSQVRMEDTEEKKLLIYEKILNMELEQPEAQKGYKLIWEKRGDEAFQAHKYDDALKAYQKSDIIEKIKKVESQIHLNRLYLDALNSLKENKINNSRKLLAQVLTCEPTFREASRYMHISVTGIDTEALNKTIDENNDALSCLKKEKQELIKRINDLEEENKKLKNCSVVRDKIEMENKIHALEQERVELKNLQNKLKNMIEQSVEEKKFRTGDTKNGDHF